MHNKLNSLSSVTIDFIKRVEHIFPNIKAITYSLDREKEDLQQTIYMISSDSSGVDVYFYHMTPNDIKSLINEAFDESSFNIHQYLGLLRIYNQLLYNKISDRYNFSVRLIDYYVSDQENFKFQIKAMTQNGVTFLLIFNGSSPFQKIDFEEEDDGLFSYHIDLNNNRDYDAVREALNFQVKKYTSLESINISNMNQHVALIHMIKYN